MIWLVASLIKPFAICPGGIQSEITSVMTWQFQLSKVFSNQVFQMESRGLDGAFFFSLVLCFAIFLAIVQKSWRCLHSMSKKCWVDDIPFQKKFHQVIPVQVAWNTLYTQFLNSRPFRKYGASNESSMIERWERVRAYYLCQTMELLALDKLLVTFWGGKGCFSGPDNGPWGGGRRGDQGSSQDCRKHLHIFHW